MSVRKLYLDCSSIFLAAAEVGVARYLGKQAGTGNRKLRAGGVDAFGGELQIVVLLERRANEFLQLRILKHLPPGKIGIRGSLRLKLRIVRQVAKSSRSLNRRPMILRADHATGKQAGSNVGGAAISRVFMIRNSIRTPHSVRNASRRDVISISRRR